MEKFTPLPNVISYKAHARKRYPNQSQKIIVSLLFVAFFLFSPVSKVYALSCSSNGTGGGNFNDAAIWTACGGGTPAATDSITINSGDTVTLVATTTVAGININSTGILGANTRALTNTAGYINNGSHTSTTSTMTLSGPSGTVIDGNGTYTATSGVMAITTADKIIAADSQLSIPRVTVTGVTLTNNSTAGFSVTTALIGTGTFTQGSSAILNLRGTSTVTTLDASVNSNEVHYTSTTANQTIKAATYYHLFIEKTGRIGTASGTTNVLGNLTVTAGTIRFAGSTFTVTGTTDIYGTLTDNSGGGSGGNNVFNGLVTVHSGAIWLGIVGEVCDFHFGNGLVMNGASFTSATGVYYFETNNQSITGSSSFTIDNVSVTGIQLSNNSTGTLTVLTALSGTGEFIQGINANLKIGGTSTITTFSAPASGNTVDFNGSAVQTINPATYYNLVLSNKIQNGAYIDADSSDTVTAGDTRVFTGHPAFAGFGYTVGSTVAGGDTDIGTVIELPTGSRNLKKTGTGSTQFVYGTDGAYTDTEASGTVTAGDVRIAIGSTVAFGLGYAVGSSVVSGDTDIGTAIVLPTVANNLKKTGINSTTGSARVVFVYSYTDSDTLSADTTVTESLVLGGVLLSTGSNKLILGASTTFSRTSGYVIGTIRKNYTSSTSFTYALGDSSNYTPIDLTLVGVTGSGSVDGTVTAGDNPDIANSGIDSTKSVNRYWTLTNNALSFTSYSSVFNFVSGDVDSGVTVADMRIAKKTAGSWGIVSSTCTGTSCTGTGMTGMSDFQIGIPTSTPTSTPTPTPNSSGGGGGSSGGGTSSSTPTVPSAVSAAAPVIVAALLPLPIPGVAVPIALFDIVSSPLFPDTGNEPLFLNLGSTSIFPVVTPAFLIGSFLGFLFLRVFRHRRKWRRMSRVLRIVGRQQGSLGSLSGFLFLASRRRRRSRFLRLTQTQQRHI